MPDMDSMIGVCRNARALNSETSHWVGDSIKWSPQGGGCLMWTRDGKDWSSQDEGEFLVPVDAEHALGWYKAKGVIVDWNSLDDHAVVFQG